jgi:hypothetical protein
MPPRPGGPGGGGPRQASRAGVAEALAQPPAQDARTDVLDALDAMYCLFHYMGEGELGRGQEEPVAAGIRLVWDARRTVKQPGPYGSGWAGALARAVGPLHTMLGEQQQPGGAGPSGGPAEPAQLVVWAPCEPARPEAGGSHAAAGGGSAEARWTEAQQQQAGRALECPARLLPLIVAFTTATDPELPGLLVALHGLIMMAAQRCAPGLVDVLTLEVGKWGWECGGWGGHDRPPGAAPPRTLLDVGGGVGTTGRPARPPLDYCWILGGGVARPAKHGPILTSSNACLQ